MLSGFYRFLIILALSWGISAQARAASGSLTEMTTKPAQAEIVKIGFFAVNVYGVDPAASTFTFDGYVWLRWKGNINPTDTLEFVNAVDKSSLSKTYLYDSPQTMPDGSKYQIMRIESQFFKAFSLSDFPLDNHELTIAVEDSLRGSDELVFEIDRPDSGLSPNFSVSGWSLDGWNTKTYINDYGSNFGDRRVTQASRFTQMNFNIKIARPVSYFVWKLLLPLLVVLCGAWIALLLNPSLTETRAALPASALLTTVFLQQSYTATLPETGGLVLLDQIYVVAYVLIVVTLGRVIVKSREVETMDDAQIIKLRRLDGFVLAVQAAVFVVATLLIVFKF